MLPVLFFLVLIAFAVRMPFVLFRAARKVWRVR